MFWVSIPTFLGLFLAGAAAGPGEASAIFLFIGFFIGLAGASIHCTYISFRKGSLQEKVVSVLVLVFFSTCILWLRFTPPTCQYTEKNAYAKISKHLLRANLNPENLGSAKFNSNDCSYSYTYEGPEGKYEHLFTRWGEVHVWDYSQGEL